jgi:tRNA-binding protein
MIPAPVKPTIPFDVLEQIDVRVGTILSVEDVPGSDKLLRLTVDFGDHQRRILAGMPAPATSELPGALKIGGPGKQERENPQEIEGRQALFVVNLAPRKMMGEVSEGMLFDLGYADGVTPSLAVPERPVPNGARAG